MAKKSKTILITGASSGIGKSTAKLFAGEDWNVIATMRNPEKDGAEFAEFPKAMVARLDVEDRDSIIDAIDAGIVRFGRIDVLVNNAGYGQYGLFEAIPREKVQQQLNVNILGVMDVTRTILPHFRTNKGGAIINVSSGAGLFGLPMATPYCASKFALEGFSESLSYELASQNIVVKLVIPHGGVTETSFIDRSTKEHAPDAGLKDYDAFAARTRKAFETMTAARSIGADEVARMIHTAATDGSRQLRYLVGDDSRGFVKARREMSEDDYIAYMREYFAKDG